MQVLTEPKLAETQTHFHLPTVTHRPDFHLEYEQTNQKWQFSFDSRRVKETITYKFAVCSSSVGTLASVWFYAKLYKSSIDRYAFWSLAGSWFAATRGLDLVWGRVNLIQS